MATIRPQAGGGIDIFYVHTDHLNTPRRISRPSDNAIVWRWDSDPFGATAANEDPDGDSQVVIHNVRFPGQYFDMETGLSYNYFRDYDPGTGRYVESDPVGLSGGMNTYGYVFQNPVSNSDSTGRFVPAIAAACVANPALCGAVVIGSGILLNEVWQEIVRRNATAANDPEYCPQCKLIDAEFGGAIGEVNEDGIHELASRLTCIYFCPSSGRVISQEHFIPPGMEVIFRSKEDMIRWCPESIDEYAPW